MDLQILRTEAGEELVVLPRRAFDALLARLGDEEAEDRMTARLAQEARAALAEGTALILPAWLTDGMAAHRHPVRVAREHFGRNEAQLASEAGIGPAERAAIEQGHGAAPPAGLDAISAALGLDPRLLRRVCADAPT